MFLVPVAQLPLSPPLTLMAHSPDLSTIQCLVRGPLFFLSRMLFGGSLIHCHDFNHNLMSPKSASSFLASLASWTQTQGKLDIIAICRSYNRRTNLNLSKMELHVAGILLSSSERSWNPYQKSGPCLQVSPPLHHPHSQSASGCSVF